VGTEELFFVFPFVFSVICFRKIAAAESVLARLVRVPNPSFFGSVAFSPAIVICLEDAERKGQVDMYVLRMYALLRPNRAAAVSALKYYVLYSAYMQSRSLWVTVAALLAVFVPVLSSGQK
jgi:hypothetical protein